MIRFLDKEAACIQKEMYERDRFFRYFLDVRSHKAEGYEIVLVYQGEEYYGYVTYESVLRREGEEGIILEKYVMAQDEDLFSGLRQFFDCGIGETGYLPVFDSTMRLVYFAYQYKTSIVDLMEKDFFPIMENGGDLLFLRELYPQAEKVRIYDFNEWAYRLFCILRSRQIPVEVFGEKWEVFCPGIHESSQVQYGDIPAEKTMSIYAEGTGHWMHERGFGYPGYDLDGSWDFLMDIIRVNVLRELDKLKMELQEKGVRALTMIFPSFDELGHYTLDEFYRNRMGIQLEIAFLNEEDSLVSEQVLKCWCREGGEKFKDAVAVKARRKSQSIPVGNESVSYKCFGEGRRALYLLGPCVVDGMMVDDEDSIAAFLYRELQKYPNADCKVKCFSSNSYNLTIWRQILETLTLYEGDLVVLVSDNTLSESAFGGRAASCPSDVDLKAIFGRRQADWFWNRPVHTNQRGNEAIARALADEYLAEKLERLPEARKLAQPGKCCLPQGAEHELQDYLEKVREKELKEGKIGGIVMNCNPMTKGHLYLIEEALKRVDFLYIFLVEEDRSEFSFADRMAVVSAVTKKYGNAKAVPSGRFILSYETMPIYFEKARRQEETLDATRDLKIFGEKIAPGLGITVRFVGEEPNDKITYQYNESMKVLLGYYGIRLEELPRLEKDGEAISASTVRKYWRSGKLDKVQELVPPETFKMLLRRKDN